jgi:GH43 family beta-xylosidase
MNKRVVAGIAVLAVAVLAGEAALATSIMDARREERTNTAELQASEAALQHERNTIVAAQGRLTDTKHTIATRKKEQKEATAAIAAAEKLLAQASRDLDAAEVQSSATAAAVQALKTCVDAARTATDARNAGDASKAVATLKAAQKTCNSTTEGDADRAVFPFDFSDPSVLRVGNTYYAYATNAAIGNVQTLSSTDLKYWKIVGDALPHMAAWAKPNVTWAPSVIALGGKYVLYYTANETASRQQCISVAVGNSPAGPFLDLSAAPLVCQHYLQGSIDPKPFVDGAGVPWLLWKNEPGGLMPPSIWSQQLSPDGTAMVGANSVLISADREWEGGVVEAPAMVKVDGELVLHYSANFWSSDRYSVGQARCATPRGPCRKVGEGPVLASHDTLAGPGGADFFRSTSGELWAVYHAYRAPQVGYPASRMLHVARVHITGNTTTFEPSEL